MHFSTSDENFRKKLLYFFRVKVPYRVFQDFESPASLNLCHCRQLRFPDYRLFNSAHNSKKHSSETLDQTVPSNLEIVIVSSGKGLN